MAKKYLEWGWAVCRLMRGNFCYLSDFVRGERRMQMKGWVVRGLPILQPKWIIKVEIIQREKTNNDKKTCRHDPTPYAHTHTPIKAAKIIQSDRLCEVNSLTLITSQQYKGVEKLSHNLMRRQLFRATSVLKMNRCSDYTSPFCIILTVFRVF